MLRQNAAALGLLCVSSVVVLLLWSGKDQSSLVASFSFLPPKYGQKTSCSRDSHGDTDTGPVSRDITWQEPWPQRQMGHTPGTEHEYSTVHYLWCGKRTFRFHDYLSVLSAVRVLQPLRVIFHVTEIPGTDDYNTWFQELTQYLPGLELQQMTPSGECGSLAMLRDVLGFLQASGGGVFIGQSLVLAGPPPPPSRDQPFVLSLVKGPGSTDLTRCIIFAKQAFNEFNNLVHVRDILSGEAPRCVSVQAYNDNSSSSKSNDIDDDDDDYTTPDTSQWCIDLDQAESPLYPRDIVSADTPFAELARWLFYGRRSTLVPQPSPNTVIPRVTHYIWMAETSQDSGDLFEGPTGFTRFLSILSSLYVAGFQHVYLHLEKTPEGVWWKALAGENVTVIHVHRPRSVYLHPVSVVQHASDIARYLLLYKYGGAYQDVDVVWTQRIPDSLLSYPTVVAMDWARRGHFPDTFNLGVMLSRPGAPWLRHFLQSHRDFRDREWAYNSLQMSYRTFELYPDTVFVDPHLEVLCYRGICHPTWETGYVRSEFDRRPTVPFEWRTEVRSIHLIHPEPFASFASPEALKNGTDMFAEIGRFILEKSGRTDLLN